MRLSNHLIRQSEKQKNGEWKKWHRDVMRRKLLAHMIQGLAVTRYQVILILPKLKLEIKVLLFLIVLFY
ncbi:hypothetical protein PROPEN_03741 [Proteus penneri ATCC 35198]|nr:hypothetical protein PROPEN_03741 [Proteus penneri ATCC 35198]